MLRTLVLAALAAAPALANDVEPKTYSLTPAEREAAINSAAGKPETSALLPDPERDRILGNSLYSDNTVPDRKPHGEISMFVGTGGARGIAGSIGMQLGDNGYGQFSFEQSQFSSRGYGYRPFTGAGFGLGFSSGSARPFGY